MAVYGIEALWILGPVVWSLLENVGGLPGPPVGCLNINPFVLAWAPYDSSWGLGIEFYALVLGAASLLSAGLVAYAVLRLRAQTSRGKATRTTHPIVAFRSAKVRLLTTARATKVFRVISRALAWLEARRRSPSLDNDPVLWREWRRGRPSRLARIMWGCYIALAMAGTAPSILLAVTGDRLDQATLGLLSGLQATFGLLLVAIYAAHCTGRRASHEAASMSS